jgi:hypothetical protein
MVVREARKNRSAPPIVQLGSAQPGPARAECRSWERLRGGPPEQVPRGTPRPRCRSFRRRSCCKPTQRGARPAEEVIQVENRIGEVRGRRRCSRRAEGQRRAAAAERRPPSRTAAAGPC